MKNDLSPFINAHPGVTIVVLGGGPELAKLSNEQRQWLNNSITIATNWSFAALPGNNPTYWIGGHEGVCILASHMCAPGVKLIQVTRDEHSPVVPRCTAVMRSFDQGSIHNSKFIASGNNVSYSAIHLAYRMGASRILILGVDMINSLYYFNLIPALEEQIRQGLKYCINNQKALTQTGRAELHRYYETKFNHTLLRKGRYPVVMVRRFNRLIQEIQSRGVDVCFTGTPGMLHNTSCRVASWEDVMKERVLDGTQRLAV